VFRKNAQLLLQVIDSDDLEKLVPEITDHLPMEKLDDLPFGLGKKINEGFGGFMGRIAAQFLLIKNVYFRKLFLSEIKCFWLIQQENRRNQRKARSYSRYYQKTAGRKITRILRRAAWESEDQPEKVVEQGCYGRVV